MGRGVSCGGGQSSLGYLFGSSESAGSTPPKKNEVTPPKKNEVTPPKKNEVHTAVSSIPSSTPAVASPENGTKTSENVPGHLKNNYLRADGQNCGNFITDRPSTKVHAAPGGGSSLGYLFGDNGK